MNRIAIYTCVTGNYDNLHSPDVCDPDVDYICFVPSHCRVEGVEGWIVRTFDYVGETMQDTSRFPKLNPHIVLPDYEYSLWIDGNVTITSHELIDIVKRKVDSGILYSGIRHPRGGDIYEEAMRCLRGKRDSFWNVFRSVRFLKREGFPAGIPVMENNVVLRKHLDPAIIETDCLWWQLYLKYSRRDQLSLMYCLDKNKIPLDLLIPEGYSAKNWPGLHLYRHRKSTKKKISGVRKSINEYIHKIPKAFLRLYISTFIK